MRKYETIFILNPDLSEEDSREAIEKVTGIVQSLQGEVLKTEEWGKKRLAYEIKRMSKGLFVILHFMGTTEVLTELERNLRLMDAVLKYQTVRLDPKQEKIIQMLAEEKASEKEEKPESQAEQAEDDTEKPPREDESQDVTQEQPPPEVKPEPEAPGSDEKEGTGS